MAKARPKKVVACCVVPIDSVESVEAIAAKLVDEREDVNGCDGGLPLMSKLTSVSIHTMTIVLFPDKAGVTLGIEYGEFDDDADEDVSNAGNVGTACVGHHLSASNKRKPKTTC